MFRFEYEIDRKFEYEDKKLICVKDLNLAEGCCKCYFNDRKCNDLLCSAQTRKDYTDVHFELIKEINNGQNFYLIHDDEGVIFSLKYETFTEANEFAENCSKQYPGVNFYVMKTICDWKATVTKPIRTYY